MSTEQLKVIQSYLSCGGNVPNHVKYDIHRYLTVLLKKHLASNKEGSAQEKTDLGLLIQQAFSIFMVCPPASNESQLLEIILAIWSSEGNDKYFFNESRLIIDLCNQYP